MRTSLRLPIFAAVFCLVSTAAQAGSTAPAPGPAPTPDRQAKLLAEARHLLDTPPQQPCWGDSTERDEDLKTGDEMTEQEILRYLHAHEHPGA